MKNTSPWKFYFAGAFLLWLAILFNVGFMAALFAAGGILVFTAAISAIVYS